MRFNVFKKLIFFLLIIWIALSIFRTFYNLSKVFTEEKNWIFLSDEQKRERIFKDLHKIFRIVEEKTDKNSNIIFFSKDKKEYYLGRYYLYPRRLYYIDSINKIDNLQNKSKYNYIFIYKDSRNGTSLLPKDRFLKYIPVDKYSSLNINWALYKL